MSKSAIDTFLEDLLDQQGYEDAPEKIRKELREDLQARLDEFIMTKTISAFSLQELEEFEKLLDAEDTKPEELKQFAMEHIPDYDTFMTATLLMFRDAYLTS